MLESIMNAVLFLIICLFISIPWIFLSPSFYGTHLLFPGKVLELTTDIVDPQAHCIQFSRALMAIGLKGWLLDIIAFGVNTMLLMLLSAIVIAVLVSWRSYNDKLDNVGFFEWIGVYTITTLIFMPRGVFKFYSAYYTPMIIIALLSSFSYLIRKKGTLATILVLALVIFFGYNIWLLGINRLFFPFLLVMICTIICTSASIRIYFRRKTRTSPFLQ